MFSYFIRIESVIAFWHLSFIFGIFCQSKIHLLTLGSSYYRHFFYSFLYFPNLSKICLLASGSCLRFGAEERSIRKLYPGESTFSYIWKANDDISFGHFLIEKDELWIDIMLTINWYLLYLYSHWPTIQSFKR